MQVPSPHLDEEKSATPGISPGIVEDEEFLLREMFNPQHVQDGEVFETGIPAKDLWNKGFSVHRMKYVSSDFIKVSMEEKLSRTRKGEPWKDEGVAKLQTLSVRQLLAEDDKRAFVVIDTATEDNPGHASIYMAEYIAEPKKGERHARRFRHLLLDLLQNRMTINEAYAGVIG